MIRIGILIFTILGLCGCTMNDQQQQAWNHFWNTETPDALSQDSVETRQSYRQWTELTKVGQKSLALYESMLNRPDNDQQIYKLQKKTFPSPYEASEYEFVLK